ncbi:MAG TPA: Rieske 2Fe-2S domain-containing protein [Chloroflexota bacterium]|nr:Rieske 2Fe-2S domain-containing protein [Chloroflexota bacterium]
MLSQEENEAVSRVGPGTPMGELMRRYWLPGLLSSELPERDGPPLRLRLLGEDLIAFRDSNGLVGILGVHCPHRGASLFFGRNEAAGLRCVYHGWKFDVHGRCVDMPNEPPESNFKDKVRVTSYASREVGGAVWVYMGPGRPAPPLPDLEWMTVPPERRYQAKRVQHCNWLQALEGEIDQSHVSFVHRRFDGGNGRGQVDLIRTRDTHPRFEVMDTPYGVVIGAGRVADESLRYWRITQFLMPFWSMTGPYGENPIRHTRAWVPIDDETSVLFSVTFHPLRPLTDEEIGRMKAGSGAGYVGEGKFLPPTSQPFGAWRPRAGMENDFLLDRALQRSTFFSGIPEFWAQDAAVQETMGPICDRTHEHLGTSDLGVIRVRQRLLSAALALRDQGIAPESAMDGSLYRVRGAAVMVPAGESWFEASALHREVIAGTNPGGV